MEPQLYTHSTEEAPQQPRNNPYLIPLSIVIAGVIIAGAIVIKSPKGPAVAQQAPTENAAAAIEAFKDVSGEDHILGSPNATIKIVEYSDMECPYCKQFHSTLTRLMNEYGKAGKLAWVYRHFPLESIHPKAPIEAHAAECVAELGGEEKFWQFINKIYDITPANNGLDLTLLEKTATSFGIDGAAFKSCQESGRHRDRISKQTDDAIASGGRGTPWSILITKSGQRIAIDGAYPYAQMKEAIDQALSE